MDVIFTRNKVEINDTWYLFLSLIIFIREVQVYVTGYD